MSKQKLKKRKLRYLVVVETDTDFKEAIIDGMMTQIIPPAFKASYPGKPNKMTVNKLDI